MESNENFVYQVFNQGVEFTKEFVKKVKMLNQDVNICAQTLVDNSGIKDFIISSHPLQQLILPTDYKKDILKKNILNIPVEAFKLRMSGQFLDFHIEESDMNYIVDILKLFNPSVEIDYIYNNEKKVGKISCSVPLGKLKFPNGGIMGIDKDGYVGHLRDRIMHYKINDELNTTDLDKQFVWTQQMYFENFSYAQQQNEIDRLDEQLMKKGSISESKSIISDEVSTFLPPKDTDTLENSHLKKMTPEEELAKMARENRKFTILQRERAMNEAQKAKNKSAIMAGLCILGVAVALLFNEQVMGQDINSILQQELNTIYSWKALGQYFQNIGPLITLLSASAATFIGKYLKNSKKIKQVQNEFIDFNASLENIQIFGGSENAKSR